MRSRFDLILVYTSHRRHEDYLNIVKYLARSYRIGIWQCESYDRSGKIEKEYFDRCVAYGASVVQGAADCSALILPRFGKIQKGARGIPQDILETLPQLISAKKVYVLVGGIFNGHPAIKEIVSVFGKVTILAGRKKYLGLADPQILSTIEEHSLEVIEVGYPYRNHPVFPDFETDYLLAFPSHVSINLKCS